MQKYILAFYMGKFLYFLKLECTKNTIRLFGKNWHIIAEKLNINLLNSNKIHDYCSYIRRISKNIFSDVYAHLSIFKKHLGKAANVAFTVYKNMEVCAKDIRLHSSAFAICSPHSMRSVGIPVKAEVITTIRLSAKQSVASS